MKNKIAIVVAIVAISFGCNFKKKTTSTTTGTDGTRLPGTVILVKDVEYPRVAVNDETIFWSEGDFGGPTALLHSMPAAGDEHPVTDLMKNISAPMVLTLDAEHLYWVGGGKVMRIDLDGASPVTLADCWSSSPLALDAQNVYFASAYPGTNLAGDATSVPLGGGTPTRRDIFGTHFAIDDKYLYTANGDEVRRAIQGSPLAGGDTVFISDAIVPDSPLVAVDDLNLYYTAGGIMKYSKTDKTATKLAPLVGTATFLHADGDSLYYVDSGGLGTGHSILKVPVAGGTPVTMATGISEVSSIATDEQSLYWGVLDPRKGSIMRMTPK